MRAIEREQIQRDISEAFDFVRFILKKPQWLKKIKDGSEIRFLPAKSGHVPAPSHLPKKVQAFSAETIFHTL